MVDIHQFPLATPPMAVGHPGDTCFAATGFPTIKFFGSDGTADDFQGMRHEVM